MKKIIVVACAIALASVVQAAAVGWGLMGCANYKGDAYSFFVIGQNGVESVAQITDLVAKGSDFSTYALGGGTINNSGLANVAASASGVKLDAGTKYEAFFVVFDAPKAADSANYIAITSAQSANLIQNPNATAANFTFSAGNQQTFVNNASNWSKVQGSGVPEPTSGLLLVLGCAALALRRKQK